MEKEVEKQKKRKSGKQRERPRIAGHFFQKKPFWTGMSLIILYFLMDAYLLDTGEELKTITLGLCLGGSLGLFYLYYVHGRLFGPERKDTKDIPSFIKNKKRASGIGFLILLLISVLLFIGYDPIATDWFSSLGETYYRSQLTLLLLIAPMIEELAFRYFLYDRWARRKYGVVKGILLTGLIFVICHPVGNIQSIILYWVPTLVFYMIYETFGLYGSITTHMIFNFVAL